MVLKEFDPKLMRFLYFLATHQKKMNSVEVSREVKKEGWNLSDRTIRRWFRILNEKREINYFMNLRYELFGIVPTFVLFYSNEKEKLSKIIPTLAYGIRGILLNSLKKVNLFQYAVPKNSVSDFKKFWFSAKKYRLIEDYIIYSHKTSITFYAPFDKIISETGEIVLQEKDYAPDYFMSLYEKINKHQSKLNVNNYLLEYPILVPILYSSFGENFSSKKVWMSLKKCSEKIWNFVPKKLLRHGQKDGIAIKYLQDVLKLIEENKDKLFQQIRIGYRPFVEGKNNAYYLILKLKNENKLNEFIKDLHKRTIQLQYMPPNKGNEHMFFIVTNENKFLEIMYNTIPKYIDYNYENKLILKEKDPNKNYYSKVDWTMFDPVKKEWIYEHEKYMKELKKLAKEVRTKQPLKEP